MKSPTLPVRKPSFMMGLETGVLVSDMLVRIDVPKTNDKRCSDGDCLTLEPYVYDDVPRVEICITGLPAALDRCVDQGFAVGYMSITHIGSGNKRRSLQIEIHVEAWGAKPRFKIQGALMPFSPDEFFGCIQVPCVKGLFFGISRIPSKIRGARPKKLVVETAPTTHQQLAA